FLIGFNLFGPVKQPPLTFPMEGWNITVDFPINDRLTEFVYYLDRQIMAIGGRLYTAKCSRVPADRFPAMYPEIDSWIATRRRVDSNGVFVSDMGRRLELL